MAKTRRKYKGNATVATISAGLSAGSVSAVISAATGWPTSGPFYCVVSPGTSSEEKILVGSISGTTISSLTRGVDDTADQTHAAGCTIYPVFTSIDADEANELTASYTTRGDIIYQGASTFTRLGVGSSGYVLKSNGTDPSWGQISNNSIDAAAAIELSKLATGALPTAITVSSTNLVDLTVDTADIKDDAVTSAKIAAPTLTSKTDSFTLALVDENCTLQCNKATAMTLTVPTSAVAFANGSVVTIMQYGAGQVTVTGDAGVNIRSSNGFKLRTQYSMATLVKISSTEWVLSGDTVV